MADITLGVVIGDVWPDAIGSVLGEWARKRANHARTILLEEVRTGRTFPQHAAKQDEVIAMLYAWSNAVREGANFEALRLLARVLDGFLDEDTLQSDRFRQLALITTSLTRLELIFAAFLMKAELELPHEDRGGPAQRGEQVFAEARRSLMNHVRSLTFEEVDQLAWALLRTGLVIGIPSGETLTCRPSPLLRDFTRLARLDQWATSQMEI